MEKERDSMVFYRSMLDGIEILDDISIKYQCYLAIFNYGFYGKEPAQDAPDLVKSIFKLVQISIDKNKEKHAIAVVNGKKGGAPIGNQNARKNYKELNIAKQ